MLKESKVRYAEEKYSIGDMIIVHIGSSDILSMITQPDAGRIQVVSLETGNRWDESIPVMNVTSIPESIVKVLTHDKPFTRINEATIIRR